MRRVLWLVGLIIVVLSVGRLWLASSYASHPATALDIAPSQSSVSSLQSSLRPWPTWTPIPTPISPTATPIPDLSGSKLDQFPFETCVTSWCEEYYNGYWQGGPLGNMVNARRSSEIDYYWGLDNPMSGVNREDWAARYRRRVRLHTPGIYTFYVYHDDGVKVLMNNVSVFGDSLWGELGPSVPKFNYFRREVLGNQDLDIEIMFFDHAGVAILKFWWEFEPSCQLQPGGQDCQRFPNYFSGWRGEYFNSPNYPTAWPSGVTAEWPVNLYNNLTVIRDDRSSGPDVPGQEGDGLYFDWGLGSPAGGIPDDYFTARWTRKLQFAGGFYRFYYRVDDGGRLKIDDRYVIDQWRSANQATGPNTYTYDTYLAPGDHTIVAEYQELVGGATIRLWWEAR